MLVDKKQTEMDGTMMKAQVHGGARVSVKYGQDVSAKVGGQAHAGLPCILSSCHWLPVPCESRPPYDFVTPTVTPTKPSVYCFFWGGGSCLTSKVYIVGEVGIEEELDLIGVPHFGGPSVSLSL